MAARSLGLSYGQTMRCVTLPPAIRRVIPPLLNDFIGLQKDAGMVQRLHHRRLGRAVLAAQVAQRRSPRPRAETSDGGAVRGSATGALARISRTA